MDLIDLLALRVPAPALGLDPDTYAATLDHALDRAELAVAGLPEAKREEGAEAHALAFLFGLEAAYWRRQYSGGQGPDGSFTLAEISVRMNAALAEQAAQQAIFTALAAPVQPQRGAVRGSGSVEMVVDP